MKTVKILFIIIVAAYILYQVDAKYIFEFFKENKNTNKAKAEKNNIPGNQRLKDAYKNRKSNIQILGSGKVFRILSDDKKGSKHQRFIIKLSSGQTLLIAHNIDIAPRIPKIKIGGIVKFYGKYEWNSKGGVIHWTHHDPKKRHIGGWLKYQGKKYE